jgi:hypothetical protein
VKISGLSAFTPHDGIETDQVERLLAFHVYAAMTAAINFAEGHKLTINPTGEIEVVVFVEIEP